MALTSEDLLEELQGSLGGLSFFGFSGVSAGVDSILNSFTVGQYRTLVNQAKTFLAGIDFSAFEAQFAAIAPSLDPVSRGVLQNLFDGDNSIITNALDVALDALEEFPANTLLKDAIEGLDGSTIDDKKGLDLLIDQITALVEGSALNDTIIVSGEAGRILAGAGDDTVKGGANNDRIKGDAGDDVIRGRKGDDKMTGNKGDDKVIGGGGDDTIKGGAGNDNLKGSKGADNIKGNGGADRLFGGADDDVLNGGGGKDTLTGNRGDDTLKGGAGADRFVFKKGDGDDVIQDFKQGEDKIVIGAGANDIDDLDISQQGADTLIVGDGFSITVENQNADDFDSGDFIF